MIESLPLRRVARLVNGGTPTSDEANWGGDVPWATPVDLGLHHGGVVTETARTVTALGAKSGSSIVPPGSILVSTRAPIGYVSRTGAPTAFNQGCRGLVPSSRANARFLTYALVAARPELEARGQGSTFSELSRDGLASIPVPVPPLAEQRRIADCLDAETARLDRLLEVRAVQRQRLSERRGSLLLALVGGTEANRVPSGLEWLPTIPDHWSTVRLSLLARLGSGHTPSRSHPEWWLDPTIPWITTGEVAQLRDDRLETLTETRELISEFGLANSAAEVHPRGTVVLSRTASVGFSGVMGLDMATSQDFATWTCGPRLNPYFLLWVLRAMRPWLVGTRAIGSTHKTIYMPDIQALRIPLPPLAEQSTIVTSIRRELGHLDQMHDALDSETALLLGPRVGMP